MWISLQEASARTGLSRPRAKACADALGASHNFGPGRGNGWKVMESALPEIEKMKGVAAAGDEAVASAAAVLRRPSA